jgi:hypothetical protein
MKKCLILSLIFSCLIGCQAASKKDAYAKKLASVMKSIDRMSYSDARKVTLIYAYIVKHVDYDYETYFGKANRIHAKNALLEGKAVCSGYAELFHDMCAYCKIEAPVIKGTYCDEKHEWNLVKLYNRYYYVDATIDSEDEKYFLLSAADFKDHVPETSLKTYQEKIAKESLGPRKRNYTHFGYYKLTHPAQVKIILTYDALSTQKDLTYTCWQANLPLSMRFSNHYKTAILTFKKAGDYHIEAKSRETGKVLNYYFWIS